MPPARLDRDGSQRGDRGRGHRGVEEPDAEAEHAHPGQQGQVGGLAGREGQHEYPGREQARARRHGDPGTEAAVQAPGHERGHRVDAHQRQQARTGPDRRVAQDHFHVLRQVQQRGEVDGRYQQHHGAGCREHPAAQHVGGHQGPCPQAALGEQEHGQEGHAAGQQGQDERAGESVGVGQVQADQDRGRPRRQQGAPRVVDAVLRGAGPALRDPAAGDQHGERRHREVHDEHQPPGRHVGEPAA